VVDPEITRREVISRVASGEYRNISFIHEIADSLVEDVTADILSEAAVPTSRRPKPICKPAISITRGICEGTRRHSGAFARKLSASFFEGRRALLRCTLSRPPRS